MKNLFFLNIPLSILVLLIIGSILSNSLFAQNNSGNNKNTILYANDFDTYSDGDYLAETSPDWTTWNNDPGSAEDAVISDAFALSVPNSVMVSGATDAVFPCGDLTSGAYTISFDMYVPAGKFGYFNVQQVFASEWGMSLTFMDDGSITVSCGDQAPTGLTFPQDEWFPVEINIDLDADLADCYVVNEFITEWQWSITEDGDPGTLQLGCVNMYAYDGGVGGTPEYYFDNFLFSEILEGGDPPVSIVNPNVINTYTDNGGVAYESFNIENGGELELNYEVYPIYDIEETTGINTDIIGYADENNNSGAGWENGDRYVRVAVFLTPLLQSDFIGTKLTAIEFYANDDMADFEVKIWKDQNTNTTGPDVEIYSKTYFPIGGQWNTVTIDDDIILDGEPLYIGYRFLSVANQFSIGKDEGPRVPGVNFISINPAWQEFTLDYNLSIRGIVTGNPIPAFINIPNPSGTLNGGDNTNIDVEFDPNQLENGSYTGQIVVASNDPVENYDYIDFTFNVGEDQFSIIKVLPENQTVFGETVFETSVELFDVTNLGSFELNLDFDANYLQANSVTLGGFLGSTGRQVFPLTNDIDNTNGLIEYAVTTLGSSPPGANGNGILLNIEWTSLNVDEDVNTDLILQNIQVTVPDGTLIPVSIENANITINSCYSHDFDCDCDVDIVDVTMAAYTYGSSIGNPNYNASYDLDDDGDIDIVDITMVTYDYGWECEGKSVSGISFDEIGNQNVSLNQQEKAISQIEKELVVNVEDIYQLGAYELNYSFDPENIEILSVEEGSFLKDSGREILELLKKINQEKGLIEIAMASFSNKLNGVVGDGELIKIKYIKKGSSSQADFKLVKGQLARIDAKIIPYKSKYQKENNLYLNFDVIPNPNYGNFNVDFQIQTKGIYSIILYSVSGEEYSLVPEKEFDTGQYQFKIADKNLPAGMYVIMLENSGNTIKSKKIVIY